MKKNTFEFFLSYFAGWRAVYLFCGWVLIMTLIVLAFSEKYSSTIFGYAVDSQDRLYVGLNGHIEVFENEEPIRSFSSLTSRAYSFTIDENDVIILATANRNYKLDLQGNVITELEHGSGLLNEIRNLNRHEVTVNGNDYRLINLGWPRILKNGNAVAYRIPAWAVCLRAAVLIYVLGLIILIAKMAKEILNNGSTKD